MARKQHKMRFFPLSVYSSGEWKVKSCGRRRPFNSWKLDDGWPLHLIEFSDNIVNTKCNIFFSVSFWNYKTARPRTAQLLHRRRCARDSTFNVNWEILNAFGLSSMLCGLDNLAHNNICDAIFHSLHAVIEDMQRRIIKYRVPPLSVTMKMLDFVVIVSQPSQSSFAIKEKKIKSRRTFANIIDRNRQRIANLQFSKTRSRRINGHFTV